jgi:hypothetical protein
MHLPTRAAVLAAATGAVLALGALPALAGTSPVSVHSARLVARGAGVTVSVSVTCDPYTNYNGQPSTVVDVTVAFREAVRHGNLTTGSTDLGFLDICDSTPHSLAVLVLPSPYAAIKGSALVQTTTRFDTFGGPPPTVTYTNVVTVK